MYDWLHFAVVIGVQAFFYCLLAYTNKKTQALTLTRAASIGLLGIVFGVSFDLVVGQYAGVFSYRLGFGLPFLIVNGALSYGIAIATVLLLQHKEFFSFYFYSALLGAVYEVVNYFSPVWSWDFMSGKGLEEALVILVAYTGFTLVLAGILSVVTRTRFVIFKNRVLPF